MESFLSLSRDNATIRGYVLKQRQDHFGVFLILQTIKKKTDTGNLVADY